MLTLVLQSTSELLDDALELVREYAYWLGSDCAKQFACDLNTLYGMVAPVDRREVIKAFNRDRYTTSYIESELERYAERLLSFKNAMEYLARNSHMPQWLMVDVAADWELHYQDRLALHASWDDSYDDASYEDWKIAAYR